MDITHNKVFVTEDRWLTRQTYTTAYSYIDPCVTHMDQKVQYRLGKSNAKILLAKQNYTLSDKVISTCSWQHTILVSVQVGFKGPRKVTVLINL